MRICLLVYLVWPTGHLVFACGPVRLDSIGHCELRVVSIQKISESVGARVFREMQIEVTAKKNIHSMMIRIVQESLYLISMKFKESVRDLINVAKVEAAAFGNFRRAVLLLFF